MNRDRDGRVRTAQEEQDEGIQLESIDLQGQYTVRDNTSTSSVDPPLIDFEEFTPEDPLVLDQLEEYETAETPSTFRDILIPQNPDILVGKWQRPYRRRRDADSERLVNADSVDMDAIPTDPNQFRVQYDGAKEFEKRTDIQRNWSTLLLLTVGLLGGALSATMDITIFQLQRARKEFMGLTDNIVGQYFLWLIHLVFWLWLGITMTTTIAPQASGSGIPEMKSIIGGIHLKYVLGWRALLVKTIGITLALGSGMILGKEGPFIHLCCILANVLIRQRFFNQIRKNVFLLQIMLGAACAVGVSSHFGAPVGGVLFSIEVTTTYYPTRNYWYAYLGAVTGTTVWRYIWNAYFRLRPGFNSIIITNFSQNSTWFGLVELCIFALLGAFCGALAVVFVKWNAFAFRTWRRVMNSYRYIRSPYLFSLILGTITATLTFPRFIGAFMALSPTNALADLVNIKQLNDQTLNAKDWADGSELFNLFIFGLTRFILIPVGIILPIPCGLFVPSLSLGASIGRFFGEVAIRIFQGTSLLFEGSAIVAGAYGVAGAAAFTASVTGTLSTAVIIFEITGNNVHIVPVLIATLFGVVTARKISSLSIYESLAKLKNLPYLPDLKQDAYVITARDLMETKVKFITKEFNDEDVAALLENARDEKIFPVVHARDDMLLVGTVERETLEKLKDFQDKVKLYNRIREGVRETNEDGTTLVRQQLPYLPKTPSVIVRSVPIRFVEDHPLNQIHLLFITMRLMVGYVTRNGELKGVITRPILKEAIYKYDSNLTLLKD